MSCDKRGDRQIIPAFTRRGRKKKEKKKETGPKRHSNFHSKVLAGKTSLSSTDGGILTGHQVLKLDKMLHIRPTNQP